MLLSITPTNFQTVVMHQVMEKPSHYWNNSNIEKCFIDCMKRLQHGLEGNKIMDIFFWEVNLLDRVKNKTLQAECAAHLSKLLRKYEQTGQITSIFPDEGVVQTQGNTYKDSYPIKTYVGNPNSYSNLPISNKSFEDSYPSKRYLGNQVHEATKFQTFCPEICKRNRKRGEYYTGGLISSNFE